MDLELLDQLEDKVDAAVSTVRDLRGENALLREEVEGLEGKVQDLSEALAKAGESRATTDELQERCRELEKKLDGVKKRVLAMVQKIKELES